MAKKKFKFSDDIEPVFDDSDNEYEWKMPDFSVKPDPLNFSIMIIDKDTGECEEYDVTERIADDIRSML